MLKENGTLPWHTIEAASIHMDTCDGIGTREFSREVAADEKKYEDGPSIQ